MAENIVKVEDSAEEEALPKPQLAPLSAGPSSSNSLPQQLVFKNRLQQKAQQLGIPPPVYETVNEGFDHAPKFRSTVSVDGAKYTSPNSFIHRKVAEHDVSRVALEGLSRKLIDEGRAFISEGTLLCKAILNEFATKMNKGLPTYNTVSQQGPCPMFTSSLVFNDESYMGVTGRSKKDAEQLAARAVIQALLDKRDSATIVSEIIRSKFRLVNATNRVKDSCPSPYSPATASTGNSLGMLPLKRVDLNSENSLPGKVLNSGSIDCVPHHELKATVPEQSSEASDLPLAVVDTEVENTSNDSPTSGKKRKKNKKKPNKKLCIDAQLPNVAPINQSSPCSIAQ